MLKIDKLDNTDKITFCDFIGIKYNSEKNIDYSINFHHDNICDISEELILFMDLVKSKKSAKNYIYSEKNKILKFIKSGELYSKLLNTSIKSDYNKIEFDYVNNSGEYLSINIKEANWSVFSDYGNLNIVWCEFLRKMNSHSFISCSKRFRQILFGELNPKRIINLQKYHIWEVHEILKNDFNIVGVLEDEILIKIDGDKKIMDLVRSKLKKLRIPLNIKMFSLYQNICSYTGKNYTVINNITLDTYKKPKLWGVPKRLFFIHMKDAMKMPLDKEDIEFSEDGVDYKVVVKTNKWNKIGLYL